MYVSYGGNECYDFDSVGESEVFLCYSRCCYSSYCLSCGTPPSPRSGFDAVFFEIRPIRVAWSGVQIRCRISIILRSLIIVPNYHSDGRTQCDTKLGAGLDVHFVEFVAGGCEGRLTGSSTGHLWLNIRFCEGHAWGYAIDYAAYGGAVGFAISEGVI